MDVRGTVAVVTGGTGGLGQCLCHALARAGAHVCVIYKQSHELAQQVARECTALGPRAVPFQADVTDQAQIETLVQRVLDEFGRLDILVNNAAYNQWIPFKDLEQLTPEVWAYILHYNTTGPFLMMRAVAPVMLRQQRGRIVNIGSVAGLSPGGSSIAYAVSKAALIHLTRCMAVALAPHVLVNCVAPGLMEGTRMTARLDPEYVEQARRTTALMRAADKDDVADQVVTFCRTDSTTGQTVVIDAGRFYH